MKTINQERCNSCKYSYLNMSHEDKERDGGHCYMFKVVPDTVCMQNRMTVPPQIESIFSLL